MLQVSAPAPFTGRMSCGKTTTHNKKRRCMLAFGALALVACAAPVPVEDDAPETELPKVSPKPTSGASGDSDTPSSDDTDTTSSDDSDAPDDTADPVPTAPDHVPDIDARYPGIDAALTGKVAPAGCTDGWDAGSRTLSLQLNLDVPGVRLHVEEGVLKANGEACEADGAPLAPQEVQTLSVRGGAEVNVVILDFAVEGFGTRLYEQEGGFRFDGGKGEDHLYLRGSADADEYYVGAVNQRLVAALSAYPRINLWAKGFERAYASLGPGDDAWRPITQLNLGLFDLDSGSVLTVHGIDIAQMLWGGDGDDELNAGALDDVLAGGAGADVLNGGDGSDLFNEGASASGADVINGGPGVDEVSYAKRADAVTVEMCTTAAAAGCDNTCDCEPLSGGEGEEDRVINVEVVSTGAGDDVIVGSPGADYIYAGAGDDWIRGGAGSDVLQGGGGVDKLDGEQDEDICDGEAHEVTISCEI